MELLKIRLPDGVELYTHDQSQSHIEKIIRHWVDQHSDVYELPTMVKGQVNEYKRDKATGHWCYEDERGQEVMSPHAPGSYQVRGWRPIKESVSRVIDVPDTNGKQLPKCAFELVDMTETEYRSMKPYGPHPTCRMH